MHCWHTTHRGTANLGRAILCPVGVHIFVPLPPHPAYLQLGESLFQGSEL
jgi:hypothetical protein